MKQLSKISNGVKVPFVDFKRQYRKIGKHIEKEIREVLSSGQYILGEKVENFERKFAKFCGVKYALGVNNGTSALLLALMALGIKKGDEIITVSNTFVATIEAIALLGAKPVFVDINPKTCNIDTDLIERAITKKTKAILPVHLFGQPADMAPILKIARKHNLFVVEDSAQAHGAEYLGKKAGSLGNVGCFSFYPTKVLGACGEAGAVTTNSKKLAEKMKKIRNHGSDKKYEHSEIGLNFRLEALQGAVLGVKLKDLNRQIKQRRAKAKIYNQFFKGLPLVIPFEPNFAKSVYYVYVVRAPKRENLQHYLAKKGISTMIHYPLPVHLQAGYKFLGLKSGDLPETEKSANEILSLPFFPELTLEEQEYIVEKIKYFYSKYGL